MMQFFADKQSCPFRLLDGEAIRIFLARLFPAG